MYDDTAQPSLSEFGWIEQISRFVGKSPSGEVGIGDDAAVFTVPDGASLLFSTDLVAEGVHFDLELSDPADVGWKAMAVNISDIAAMGGKPLRSVVAIAGAGLVDLERLYEGILAAGREFGCEVVGGDCSSGAILVVSIAIIGLANDRGAVLRSGARSGDSVFVTGPLGASAAGLRLLQGDRNATGSLVDAHRRPVPHVAAGECATVGGATSMMDISDGLGVDLHRLLIASKVGAALNCVPVAEGATEQEALGGGEDYELLFTAPDEETINAAFDEGGVIRPVLIGTVTDLAAGLTYKGRELKPIGYEHH